jgi:hypothetical protein
VLDQPSSLRPHWGRLNSCRGGGRTPPPHPYQAGTKKPVLRIRIRIRIRIHRIHMFLGLLDPDPSVRGMDPDPDPDQDPSITKQRK